MNPTATRDDGDGHDDTTPRVSASRLLPALDQEDGDENRPYPGSTGPDPTSLASNLAASYLVIVADGPRDSVEPTEPIILDSPTATG